jgi:hypothetical protein
MLALLHGADQVRVLHSVHVVVRRKSGSCARHSQPHLGPAQLLKLPPMPLGMTTSHKALLIINFLYNMSVRGNKVLDYTRRISGCGYPKV